MHHHSSTWIFALTLTTFAFACSGGEQGNGPAVNPSASNTGGSATQSSGSSATSSSTGAASTKPTGASGSSSGASGASGSSTGASGTSTGASGTSTGASGSSGTTTSSGQTSATGTTMPNTTSSGNTTSAASSGSSASDTNTSEQGSDSSGMTGETSSRSAGCGAPTSLQSGTKMVTIGGTNRRYIVDVPADYDADTAYALIFVWHPLGGNADGVAGNGYDGLKTRANNTAIFVAPDGLEGGNQQVSGKGWWNEGDGDMTLFTTIFEDITQNACINTNRVFSTGFSFGGMMSYTVGYQFDVFRAVAPTSGNLDVVPHEENNTEPLAIMAFHGASDTFVATSSGRAALDKYVARNNCDTATEPLEPSPCVEFQGCDVPTIWCEYAGEHAPWNQMPAAVWDFFSQFE